MVVDDVGLAIEGTVGVRRLPAVYGLAHGGKTLFWTASDLYFAFYMNEVCGIVPTVTGLILGFSLLVAALADLVVGRLIAASVQNLATANRLQQAGSVVSAAALLLFALASFAIPAWRVAACTGALLLFRMAYAILDVPQNALLSLAGESMSERAAMVTVRNVMGGLARLVLATAFIPVMDTRATGAAPRFLGLVAIVAVIAVGSATVLSRQLAGHVRVVWPQPKRDDPAKGLARHYLRAAIVAAMTTVVVQLEPYLATRVIAGARSGQIFLISIAIGAILSQPLWHRFSPEPSVRSWPVAIGVVAIAALAFPTLPPTDLATIVPLGLVYGIASGGVLFTLWADFSEAAIGGPALGRYARFTASAKTGQAAAIIGVGILLGHSDAGVVLSPLWAASALTVGCFLLALTLPMLGRQGGHV